MPILWADFRGEGEIMYSSQLYVKQHLFYVVFIFILLVPSWFCMSIVGP